MVLALIKFLTALMKFLPEVRKLLRLLSESPEEARAKIMDRIIAEEEQLKKTGRPKWD